jgi:hypothetical protein
VSIEIEPLVSNTEVGGNGPYLYIKNITKKWKIHTQIFIFLCYWYQIRYWNLVSKSYFDAIYKQITNIAKKQKFSTQIFVFLRYREWIRFWDLISKFYLLYIYSQKIEKYTWYKYIYIT